MTPELFHDGRVALHAGDCIEVLRRLPACSIDAVVTDPPYHLASIVKRFGKVPAGSDRAEAQAEGVAAKSGATGVYKRASRGFMGKTWDGGEIAHRPETWAEVLRVLKPGGHCVAFHASRNWARQAVAMEDAGFEMRDTITDLFDAEGLAARFIGSLEPAQAEAFAALLAAHDGLADLFWVYGSGFPKSLDVSKAIDRALGAERPIIGTERMRDIRNGNGRAHGEGIHAAQRVGGPVYTDIVRTAAASDPARRFEGWGTALKPAFEPICLARKPLAEGSVAAQVMATGTGGINVDACRVGDDGGTRSVVGLPTPHVHAYGDGVGVGGRVVPIEAGRWPANIVHDGSAAVEGGFLADGLAADGEGRVVDRGPSGAARLLAAKSGALSAKDNPARFFYSSKADADDRLGSKHPTVKPLDLMRWLVRLVTPPGGVILDPFAGTGSTGHAALLEGFSAVLIEREEEYRADIRRRMGLVYAGPVARAAAKAKRPKASEALSLFRAHGDDTGEDAIEPAAESGAEPSAGIGGGDGYTGDSQISPHHRADRAEAVTG